MKNIISLTKRLKTLDGVQLFIVREALLVLLITIISVTAAFFVAQAGVNLAGYRGLG